MTYKLAFNESALKEWKKLGHTIQEKFKKKLRERLENPRVPASQLHGRKEQYKIKLRGAGYRLVYSVEDEIITVTVIGVGKRENASISRDTNTIVISVSDIPNQYLTFQDDKKPLKEDESVSRSWALFMEAPEQRKLMPLNIPMVTALSQAMRLAKKELTQWNIARRYLPESFPQDPAPDSRRQSPFHAALWRQYRRPRRI